MVSHVNDNNHSAFLASIVVLVCSASLLSSVWSVLLFRQGGVGDRDDDVGVDPRSRLTATDGAFDGATEGLAFAADGNFTKPRTTGQPAFGGTVRGRDASVAFACEGRVMMGACPPLPFVSWGSSNADAKRAPAAAALAKANRALTGACWWTPCSTALRMPCRRRTAAEASSSRSKRKMAALFAPASL